MSESPIDAKKMLLSIPSFAGLNDEILDAIASIAIRRSYRAGQIVFLEGEPSSGLYVVETGWLKSVKISISGREQVIRFVGPGDVFNDLGVFASGPNRVTVETLEDATVWIIERESLLRLTELYPKLSQMIIQNLSKRVLHLMRLVEDLSLRSVQSRLARLLAQTGSSDVLPRRRWSTQAEMAAHLGTVPDVLNRALRSLAEDGLIEIDRHKIKILDRAGLEEKAALGE
jgi:CRP/FNR family transcriptional regulator